MIVLETATLAAFASRLRDPGLCPGQDAYKAAAMTVTLQIKYPDFVQVTRSKTTPHYQRDVEQIYPIVDHLLHHPEGPTRPVRLLGIYLSNLDHEANGLPFSYPGPSTVHAPQG